MNKVSFVLLLLKVSFFSIAQTGSLDILPARPTAGSTFTFQYFPRNTVLQGIKDFTATAYYFEDDRYWARDVPLKQTGGIFSGQITVPLKVKLIFFSFHKETIRDNNNGEGYFTHVYDKTGQPVMGSELALASAFAGWGARIGISRNEEKAALLYKAAFSSKETKEKYSMAHFRYLARSRQEKDSSLLRSLLKAYQQRTDLKEEEIQELKLFFEWTLKDKIQSEAVYTHLQERFPRGRWRLKEAFEAFDKEQTLTGKQRIYDEISERFRPFNPEEELDLDHCAHKVVSLLVDSAHYEEAALMAQKIKNTEIKVTSFNKLTWKLGGKGFEKVPIDTKKGLLLSQQALSFLKNELRAMNHRPAHQGEAEYSRTLRGLYYSTIENYAMHLYHSGDSLQAYNHLKEAVDFYKEEHPDRNESFALLTEKVKGAGEAKNLLEKYVAESYYTPAMKKQLERLYLALQKAEGNWVNYFAALERSAYNRLREKLQEKMVLKPAPLFTLKDMAGREVSLSELKGKVVIVDFWATWCKPCLASFPTMQTAVTKYKDSADVAFLFINTWENDSNRTQKVTDFFSNNKYTFHVLYDNVNVRHRDQFVTVDQFGVDGIPTKFIIDRNGYIRFVSVGYNSRPEETLKELSIMIAMAGEKSRD